MQDPAPNPNPPGRGVRGNLERAKEREKPMQERGPGARPEQGTPFTPLQGHPPLAVLVLLGAEPSPGPALIATIITTALVEAQRLLPVQGFRDVLNFKQIFVSSLGRGGVKPRCFPRCKDEESWEKQEPSAGSQQCPQPCLP